MDLAKLRARMTKRNVAGTKIPRQDRTSTFLEAQLKRAGKTGYAGESGVVEGGAARPRLDRPARAAGGRVMRPQNSGDVQRKVIGGGKPQDHEDRTEKPREDEQYKGRDYEKQDGSKDAYEHRSDGGPKGGEQKTTHWAKGGRVVNDHEDHGAPRKKRDLERHDRLKNHEHEDTAYHGTGDGEHEELFARGGGVTHSKEHDHRGAKERKEVLHRHDRLKNEVHESSHYGHGWEKGPYGKGFPAHKAEMHHKMPGQVHPTGKAHGGTVKASDDYDGHGHFKGSGFEHRHKAQLFAGGGEVNHSEKEEHPEGRRPPPHQQPPPRERNEIVGRGEGGEAPDPNSTKSMGRMAIEGREGGGAARFSHQKPDPGRPIAADHPHGERAAREGRAGGGSDGPQDGETMIDWVNRLSRASGHDPGPGARAAESPGAATNPFLENPPQTNAGRERPDPGRGFAVRYHTSDPKSEYGIPTGGTEAHGGAIHVHHQHHLHVHHHEDGGVAVPKIGNVPHAHPDSHSGGMKGNLPHADGGRSVGPVQPQKMPPPHVSRNSGGVPDSDNRSIKREGRMEGPVHRRDGGKWIQHAVPSSHKGRLHKALHVPEGEKIPEKKLEAAEHSKSPHMRHMAQFAEAMKGVGKK